jgi:hypothetical protein
MLDIDIAESPEFISKFSNLMLEELAKELTGIQKTVIIIEIKISITKAVLFIDTPQKILESRL